VQSVRLLHDRQVTYKELLEYIRDEMSMQHVYQPVVIEALLDSDGTATLRQLALALLAADESAVSTAGARLRKMPLEVLKKRGVVASPSTGLWSLQVAKLTHTQRANLRAACHQRVAKFLDAHDPWSTVTSTVGFGVPYQVFLAAGGRCLLCHQEKPLQVDHIQPQSKQGTSTLDNLQALCADCNQGKSDGEWMDFRPLGHKHRPTQKRAGITYVWDQQLS